MHGSPAYYYCHDADFYYKWVWLVDHMIVIMTSQVAKQHMMIVQHCWSLYQLEFMLVNDLGCVWVERC